MQNYKFKIETKKETEISINLPMYVRSEYGTFMYGIISENNVIGICADSVHKSSVKSALQGDYAIITEKEFCDKYKEVATKIYDDCDNFLNGVEDRRHEILSTPLPDHDYGDEQNIEFDRFMSKQNDYHERQNDAHVFREPGDSFY